MVARDNDHGPIMAKRKQIPPQDVAFWRYEQIEEALAEGLTAEARGEIIRRLSRAPVLWPCGKSCVVPVATAYRWIRTYRKGGLEALQPKRRSDRGISRAKLPQEVISEALDQLTEDPTMSFTFLLALVRPRFPAVRICKSTLADRLRSHPDYKRIKRLRKRQKRRTRFVARAPHDIWQTDAKGPVSVVLTSGIKLAFHVLSILDDATRAVLAAIVCLQPDLAAAVRVFRMAAVRYGLPNKLYADRASIFDARAFRMGLAQMGSHRIPTQPRNAQARGKIEAYHRTLVLWFFDRLASQRVVDLMHLQQLLDGVICSLYQTHRHRGLRQSPEAALAGRVSSRSVPPTRLVEAFIQKKTLKAHRTTGEVDIAGATYLVPDELRGQQLVFCLDPAAEVPPVVEHPESQKPLALRRAAVTSQDLEPADAAAADRWGHGTLQALYDSWQGKRRPVAEPGFGLPELYALLAKATLRHVPQSDAEAALIQRVYRDIGPLPKAASEQALAVIVEQIGPKRPIKTYLDALAQRVEKHHPKARR
jgi:transposase InsO family protein